jgi:hypothetical protein
MEADGRLFTGFEGRTVNERERARRRALRLPVALLPSGEEDNRISGKLLNVSRGGVYVSTYAPLSPGTTVELEIEYPDRTARLACRVVHDRPPARPDASTIYRAGMGLCFERPDEPEVLGLVAMGQPITDSGGRRQRAR